MPKPTKQAKAFSLADPKKTLDISTRLKRRSPKVREDDKDAARIGPPPHETQHLTH